MPTVERARCEAETLLGAQLERISRRVPSDAKIADVPRDQPKPVKEFPSRMRLDLGAPVREYWL